MQCRMYLIEKRGLYYRPDAKGYTGLKSEAGLYELEQVALHFPNFDSPNQGGMTFVEVDDAPDYSSACPWDVKMKREAYLEGYLDAVENAVRKQGTDQMGMLSFTAAPSRKVYWGDTLAGSIEPVVSAAGDWAFIPEPGAQSVPNALRHRIDYRTQREVKSRLRRVTRLLDT